MAIRKIQAKSILRKYKKIDSWFLSRYGMNLYRGCSHDCAYCDGRAESYQVQGEFGKDLAVKTNAVDILRKELDPRRKRVPLKKSYIMLGGGVGDSYQPAEKNFHLTQKTLHLLSEYHFPVHILTKSTLVKRDTDLIKEINDQSKAIVSVSFSSVDSTISSLFEPGVPTPLNRLQILEHFKHEGVAVGMFFLPVLPFITDSVEIMEETLQKAHEVGVDFVIFGGMTLKEGKQKFYYYQLLQRYYPKLLGKYEKLYVGSKWGEPTKEYQELIHERFRNLCKKYHLLPRIPQYLFDKILDENDLVVVLLEHLDYMVKLEGKPSPYGYAAYQLSKSKRPLPSIANELQSISGIGKTTETIIQEILQSGRSLYLNTLLQQYKK
jgi:DNA repair photolyase